MPFRASFRLRQPATALFLAVAVPVIAEGQLPYQSSDSVALLPATRVASTSAGASVAVIDSAAIAASGARTLSELLVARVPGLSVRHRGGTEADGLEISSRGMGPVGGMAPLLIIDGIMADAHQALPVPGTTVAVSRLDDLTPAEVQRIEVLRGPAASALYGVGAAEGVIVVTTRRGSTGPLRLDVNAGAGLTDMNADFPANYQLTNGTPRQYCNPRVTSARTVQSCAPLTLYSWSPLEQASPFREGRTIVGGAALSGTASGTRIFGGVSVEDANGVTNDDRQSRVGMHGSAERALPGHLTVSAQGSWVRRDARAPTRGNMDTNDNVILRGLLGSAYDDSIGGYRPPAPVPQISQQARPSLSRVVGAARIGWQPLAWLNVDALAGQDRSTERAIRNTWSGGTSDANRDFAFLGDRWTSGTMHVGATAQYAAPVHARLATYVAYDDVRTYDVATDSSGIGSDFFQYGQTRTHARSQDATLRQHAGWGDVLDVNAGARFSVRRGISAPFGAVAARNVDASLRLPSFYSHLDLRLRAAAGIAPLVPPGSRYLAPQGMGGDAVRPLRTRQGEQEGGVDAAFGTRTHLALTWFKSQTRDAHVGFATFFGGGYSGSPLLADVSNSGMEVVASSQLIQDARFGWHATLTVATLHSNVTHLPTPPMMSTNGRLMPGYPLQGYWARDYQWSDVNGDGILTGRGEVTLVPELSYVGPSRPTLELGMQNRMTLPGGVSVAALLDYRHGQYRDNQMEASRCRVGGCQGMQDVTLSLADQARWSAVFLGYIPDITPASYLRLREVVLQWSPSRGLIGPGPFAVRVVGQNLLTWTQYEGVDPEVGASSLDAWVAPSDLFQSPLSRRVRVEVRVGVGALGGHAASGASQAGGP